MSKDFQITVTGERGELFKKVFGTETVCVRSPIRMRANLPGLGERDVYMLDLNEITPEQRERLKEELARRFCLLEDEVDAKLNEHGVPILAEDCMVSVSGAGLGLLMPEDLFGLPAPGGDNEPDVEDYWGEDD